MNRILIGLILALPVVGSAWAEAITLPKADAIFPTFAMEQVRLGQQLFYDLILSGSKQVACATCHHPRFGTSDGLSLGLGDGASGMGPERVIDPDNLPEKRVPRNAPALFNLGTTSFGRMFHDGRLEVDPDQAYGLRTPLAEDMAKGFASALSAQAMFPVLAADEMAGHYSESDVAKAVRQGILTGPGGAWDIISKRVEALPEYRTQFDGLIGVDTAITFTDIADAMAAFISFEWRADASPFDDYLRDGSGLDEAALRGVNLFYGKANCVVCHAGQFQTDNEFYAIAMPQVGPGAVARFETAHNDIGRARVTGDDADLYKFRTPSLRNITSSGPFGHDGAYATLEGVVRHHLDPVAALLAYDRAQLVLPKLPGSPDYAALDDEAEMAAIAQANELEPMTLDDREVADLLAFLNSLTDPFAATGRLGVPKTVPSGLGVPQ